MNCYFLWMSALQNGKDPYPQSDFSDWGANTGKHSFHCGCCSLVGDPRDWEPASLLCQWDFPGKNTGAGCRFFPRGSSWPSDETMYPALMLSNCGVAEDSWESLCGKEIKPVNSKGNQSWIFIGKADIEVELPILWPLDAKSQFTGKDPDSGNDRRREEKGMTVDKMVGWNHRLNRH